MKKRILHRLGGLAPLIAVCLLPLLPAPAGAGAGAEGSQPVEVDSLQIEEDTVWRGSYLVTGTVTVMKGASLRVERGTRIVFRGAAGALVVNGSFRAEGEEDSPVIFTAEGGSEGRWKGVSVHNGDREARFSFCVFRKAEPALFAGGASPVVERCVFENNGTAVTGTTESTLRITGSEFRGNERGVEASMQSHVTISESSFSETAGFSVTFSNGTGGKVAGSLFEGGKGVLVRQGTDVLIEGNRFRDCENGVVAEQAGPGVKLQGNTFSGGKTGITVVNFSTPWISCGEFRGLETAVLVNRFSRPLVEHSIFEKNERALFANQKSSFPVRKNIFRGNGEAIFVDLSSYPEIRGNNFSGNGKDLSLGIYMSADWEKKVGSGDFSRRRASSRKSPNLPGVKREGVYPGEVDARNNWWGKKVTSEMKGVGEGGNISTIHDYNDRNEVTYPDWGEGSFRLDRVLYRPWADEEFGDAGPLPDGCGDLSPGRKGEE